VHEHFSFNQIDLIELSIIERMNFKTLDNPSKIVLVNNAGILGAVDFYDKITSKDIISVYNTNLLAPAILMQKFIEKYKDVDCEKIIINISSGAAQSPYENWGNYCASKAGLEMLTKVLIKEEELQKNNFKIFSIAPGVVDTNMQDEIRSNTKENFHHIDKFIELKESSALYDSKDVAMKIVEVINLPDGKEGVFRIVI
jgi:benzil reductase ((S)-benzoin forming)